MKNMKRILASLAAAAIFYAGSVTAMAAGYDSPADVVAGLTNRPVNEVIQERLDTGKTYGTIADEAGMLDEFKEASLKLKKDVLAQNVSDGLLSQEEADEIADLIEARQAVCDGAGFGRGAGCGRGQGFGGGRGAGFGRGLRDGSCLYYN